MSIFMKGRNSVKRRVVVRGITAATAFDIPAGAVVKNVYAQNRSTTAANLTVGNAAAGAQFVASVAVPVATGVAPNTVYGLVDCTTLAVQPATVQSTVYITLSAYPTDGGTPAKGMIDVVVEYQELWGSINAAGVSQTRTGY